MIRDGTRPKPDERSAAVGDADPGFGVYVHWPFCLSKCPYCDFNSHPSLMRPQTVQGVIDAIAAKWRLASDAEITLEANPTSVEAGRARW